MSQTIYKPSRAEQIIKKSQFIGLAYPCTNKTEFQKLHESVYQEFSDSRHIAYAFKIRNSGQILSKFHDAGEPSGTAGKPIYAHLEGKHLINVVVFVVRYFGGIKLGTGGLVRAYGSTARLVLDEAELITHNVMINLEVVIPYANLKHVERHLHLFEAQICQRNFSEELHLTILLPESQRKPFSKWLKEER